MRQVAVLQKQAEPRSEGNMPRSKKKEQLNREMRKSRLALFIQQFKEEAEGRLKELEGKMENMLATIDKVFKVELMKMPPALQNMRLADLISEEESSASEVTIAIKNESPEMQKPLTRSKRVKSTDSTTVQSNSKSSAKTSKGGKGTKKTRTLVGSNSTGNLSSSATLKRTQSCVTKNIEAAPTKRKLRSVVSAGELRCSMARSAHVTVTTAQGQTVCFSEETKDEINLDLLDDVALCQIQKLTRLMEHLSGQSRCHR